MLEGVNEVGVWKCGIFGSWNLLWKVSELWQRIRSGWALHDLWCVFAHKQKPQGTFYQSLVFFLLRGSRIKHEISALGLLLVMCDCGESWPRVPVLPGEAGGSCPAGTLAAGIACQKLLPRGAGGDPLMFAELSKCR